MSDEPESSSATWKFDFEDTVNADPLARGACLKVIRALLNFASKSDPRAFRSLPDLMLDTSSTRPTVKSALKVLIRLGYLVPLYVTEGGSMMYRLVNARKEMIDDHLNIAKGSLVRERADRKKRERVRKGGEETCPPDEPENERNLPPKVKETYPNTVELNRRGSCSEGSDGSLRESVPSNDNPYGVVDDDPTVPFSIPETDAEAEEILSHFQNVNPLVLGALRRMLMAGQLTPALISANLGGRDG